MVTALNQFLWGGPARLPTGDDSAARQAALERLQLEIAKAAAAIPQSSLVAQRLPQQGPERATAANQLLANISASRNAIASPQVAQPSPLRSETIWNPPPEGSANWFNPPVTQTSGTLPPGGSQTLAQQLTARANQGELLTVAEIAQVGRGSQQMDLAHIVLGNLLRRLLAAEQTAQPGIIAQMEALQSNFFIDAEMPVLMADVANRYGFTNVSQEDFNRIWPRNGGSGKVAMPLPGYDSLSDFAGQDKLILDLLAGNYGQALAGGADSTNVRQTMMDNAAAMLIADGQPDDQSRNAANALAQDLFGKTFGTFNDAYSALLDWENVKLRSDIVGKFSLGTSEGTQEWAEYVESIRGSWAAPGQPTDYSVQVRPTGDGAVSVQDLGGTIPALDYYGGAAEERPFGQIYPGFTSLLPGTQSPAVRGALGRLQGPMEAQYLANLAMSGASPPVEGGTGWGPGITGWLQGLQRGGEGDPQFMGGEDYLDYLTRAAAVLSADPSQTLGGGITYKPPGAEDFMPISGAQQAVLEQLRDPAAQVQAFMAPFYRATRERPHARRALMDHIAREASRYQYQHPGGAFLPWALKQNLAGIQGVLNPSLGTGG